MSNHFSEAKTLLDNHKAELTATKRHLEGHRSVQADVLNIVIPMMEAQVAVFEALLGSAPEGSAG